LPAWWLTARSGRPQGPGQKANGQRKAGLGPDWPALPELRRAVTMVMAQGFRKLVLPLALTFYPLPQERKSPLDGSGFANDYRANPVVRFSKRRRTILPLRQRDLGENVLRPQEREKVAAGRMRVVGNKTNHVAGVRWRVKPT